MTSTAIPLKNGVRVFMAEYGYIVRADWYVINRVCVLKGPIYYPPASSFPMEEGTDWDIRIPDTNRNTIIENTITGYHLVIIPIELTVLSIELQALYGHCF